MTPTGAYALNIEITWIAQAAFLSALAFIASYSWLYQWWLTVVGRILGAIALATVANNLQSVLCYWHVLRGAGQFALRHEPSNWNWLNEQCRAVLPISFAVLTCMLWRMHWHSRRHVRPAADVDPVHGRAQH